MRRPSPSYPLLPLEHQALYHGEPKNTSTISGSSEFSLDAMPEDPRKLFIASAALSWAKHVPEACVEVIWSVPSSILQAY